VDGGRAFPGTNQASKTPPVSCAERSSIASDLSLQGLTQFGQFGAERRHFFAWDVLDQVSSQTGPENTARRVLGIVNQRRHLLNRRGLELYGQERQKLGDLGARRRNVRHGRETLLKSGRRSTRRA
jgi:hypothetical protein